MNQRLFTTLRIGALAAALAAAGCHGGASGSTALPPHAGAQTAALKLTVTKSAAQPAARPARSPQVIPNNAQSVSAEIFVGSASSGTPVSATCAAFTGGTSATLTLTAPYGTDTLVVQSWSGACNTAQTLGTGSVLTSFTGTGTVNAPSGDAGRIFGGSSGTITLSAPLTNVQFMNLGPFWQSVLNNITVSNDLAGSGKIQTVVPIGSTTANAPASVIYIAGGDGNGFEVNTSSGIYKSTNGGSTWAPIGYDNGLVDTRVNDLYVVPGATTSQDIVLAATQFGGIYRSIDGGASFTNVSAAAGAVHFAAVGSTIYAVDSKGVEMSTNQGLSWTLFEPIAQANALAASPTELVAGDQNGNAYVYNVGSATWTGPVAVSPSAVGCTGGPPTPGGIHSIVIDPNNASVIWATAWSCTLGGNAVSQELFLSQNAGATWTHVTSASTTSPPAAPNGTPTGWYGAQMIAPSVNFANTVYVGAEFEQWSVTPGAPPVFTPVGGQTSNSIGSTYGDMRGLTVVSNGSGGDACYIASDQGLYFQGTCGRTGSTTVLPNVLTAGLSTNYLYGFGVGGSVGSEELITTDQDFGPALGTNGGGTAANWIGTFNGTAGGSLGEGGDAEIAPNDPSKCLIANNPGSLGLAYSTDGCKTFTASTASTSGLVNATAMTFDRKTAGTVYIAAGTSGLFVSTDYGASAKLVAGNATLIAGGNSVVEARVDPTNDSHLVVIDNNTNGYASVFYSNDAGATWHASTGTSASDLFGSIAIDPIDGTHVVYVAGAPTLTVYLSTDGGATFTPSTPAALQVVRRMMASTFDQLAPLKLRFGPPHPLYLHSTFGVPTSPMHVMVGADGTIAPQYSTSLEFNPTPPANTQPVLALATGFGLFTSTDLGATWNEIDGGSNATTISRRFAKVEWMNGYLYAATVGQGLLRSTQPLQ